MNAVAETLSAEADVMPAPLVFTDSAQVDAYLGVFLTETDRAPRKSVVTKRFVDNNPSVGRSYEELFRLLTGLIHVRKNNNEALPCDWMPGDKVLVPSADAINVVTGPAGSLAFGPFTIPPGLSGLTFYTQWATFDTGVPSGEFAFSNAQSHTLP